MESVAFSVVFDAIASDLGDRPFLVWPTGQRSYSEVLARTRRFARFLAAQGLGVQRERSELVNHESGQDHVGICTGNRPEYVEAMFGALRARCAPANVNYRYVAEELAYLVDHCGLNVLVYEADNADTIRQLLDRTGPLKLLIEVGGGNEPVVPGAVPFEAIMADASVDDVVLPQPQADDLCVVCTGGTTGMPKAVLWHQGDLFRGIMGKNHTVSGAPVSSVDDLVAEAHKTALRAMCASPLMHFAGTGMCMLYASVGASMVIAGPPRGFDATETLQAIERFGVNHLTIVGDAFGGPLASVMEQGRFDTSSLAVIGSGGSALAPELKARITAAAGRPLIIREGLGSSESGLQASSVWTGQEEAGTFQPSPNTRILDESRSFILGPSDDRVGWLATAGLVPLGYLGDPVKTAATFPVIEGVRYSVPGDYARWRSDGRIKLLGREATTINSGGEKIFAPEVEAALLHDEGVLEAVVLGRPSLRWGQEVVAIVALRAGGSIDLAAVVATAAQHIARYKLPKAVIVADAIVRTATGKVDYRWARAVVESEGEGVAR